MTRERIVVDTNVFISGLLSSTSPPARVVERVVVHGQLLGSTETLRELIETLLLPKFDRYVSRARREALLDRLAPGVERVPLAVDVDVPAGGVFVVGGWAVGDDAVEVEDVVGAGVVVTATSPADPLPADDVFDVAPEVVPVVEAVVVAGATAAAAAPLAVALKFFWRITASSMLTFAS